MRERSCISRKENTLSTVTTDDWQLALANLGDYSLDESNPAQGLDDRPDIKSSNLG
jgi:hypothetical protein